MSERERGWERERGRENKKRVCTRVCVKEMRTVRIREREGEIRGKERGVCERLEETVKVRGKERVRMGERERIRE